MTMWLASAYWQTHRPSGLAWRALSLHSLNELGKLWQWLHHNECTKNVVSGVIRPHCSTRM